MVRCGFCRAIWGDLQVPTFEKARRDVEYTVKHGCQPEGIMTFCFGQDNAEWLRSLGLAPVVMSPHPVENFTQARKRIRVGENPNNMAFGISIWRHKLEVIDKAMTDHFDSVVWLDWDVRLQIGETLPADFWDRRSAGQPLQATIRQLKIKRHGWRTTIWGDQSPHGGWIYCRDRLIVKNLITLQHVWPGVSDEHIMGLLVELRFGGWGEESIQRWKDDGYEPDCYRLGRGQVFPPEQAVFFHCG